MEQHKLELAARQKKDVRAPHTLLALAREIIAGTLATRPPPYSRNRAGLALIPLAARARPAALRAG
jgi:hypothetical protein